MKVKQFMTRNPRYLTTSHTVKDALSLMIAHKISGCPVVGNDKRVRGIITQSDIMHALDMHRNIIDAKSPLFDLVVRLLSKKDIQPLISHLSSKKVKDIMQTDVHTIDENEDMYRAVTLMNKHKIHRLVVVKNGTLAGIISKKDIIQMLSDATKASV